MPGIGACSSAEVVRKRLPPILFLGGYPRHVAGPKPLTANRDNCGRKQAAGQRQMSGRPSAFLSALSPHQGRQRRAEW